MPTITWPEISQGAANDYLEMSGSGHVIDKIMLYPTSVDSGDHIYCYYVHVNNQTDEISDLVHTMVEGMPTEYNNILHVLHSSRSIYCLRYIFD